MKLTFKISTLLVQLLIVALPFTNTSAQNDTMYIMKNGVVVGKYNVSKNIDSISFFKPNKGTFIDERDGNNYNWIKIGNQVWMTENLRYLPQVFTTNYYSTSYPYYYVVGYNGFNITEAKATLNYVTYGVLYNWNAVMQGSKSSNKNPSGVKGIAPNGWHIPSDEEWTQLENYLINNGYNYDGSIGNQGKIAISMTSLNGWNYSNLAGAVGSYGFNEYRNKSGFSAIPGSCVFGNAFETNGEYTFWWSSTQELSSIVAFCRSLFKDEINLKRTHISGQKNKANGFYVRCVRDY